MVLYKKYKNNMIEKILLGLLCVVLSACTVTKKLEDKKAKEFSNASSTAEIVKKLSSDEFEGRKPGSIGMDKASLYVESYFKEIGLQPMFNDSYRDSVLVYGKESYNIIGIINSNSPSDEYILIGAHLDHLGKRKYGTDTIYNGANDNASGVTAVLQIAKELKNHKFTKKVIVSIFTGEESGLIGAKHLAKKLKLNSIPLSYVINFDMIGNPLLSAPSKIYISGYDRSDFSDVANSLLEEEFVKFEQVDRDYGLFRCADNYPFYLEYNIPSHTISTFDFRNFKFLHHVKDEYSQLDIEHMEKIIAKSTKMIVELLERNATITLRH